MGFFTVLKQVQGFGDALVNIHASGNRTLGEAQCQTIKRQIATSYDFNAAFRADMFWNFGMLDEESHREISQRIVDYDQYDSDGYSEQLYFYTLKQVPVTNDAPRKILEVGCGSGIGLNFLSRLESPSSFIGLDLSPKAVCRANARFLRPGSLTYIQGDAESLPFGEGEFDVVINVESSHNYPNLRRFLSEVARVLRPGGFFSHVDLFTDDRHVLMEKCKVETSHQLRWLSERDISEHVKASIRRRMDPGSLFRKHLKSLLPWPAQFTIGGVMMRAYGSCFAEEKTQSRNASTLSPGTLSASWRLPDFMTSYRHTLATKPE
jgi:ubiquinone/menaquinone biosynthesis C-methylase UbiE